MYVTGLGQKDLIPIYVNSQYLYSAIMNVDSKKEEQHFCEKFDWGFKEKFWVSTFPGNI